MATECQYFPDPHYMIGQREISEKHRSKLIDWIVGIHQTWGLREETFFLTVNIIDRFLSLVKINLDTFQLLGLAAMFVACKYEEIYPPHIKDLSGLLIKAGEEI